jgi:hypothetical protein
MYDVHLRPTVYTHTLSLRPQCDSTTRPRIERRNDQTCLLYCCITSLAVWLADLVLSIWFTSLLEPRRWRALTELAVAIVCVELASRRDHVECAEALD